MLLNIIHYLVEKRKQGFPKVQDCTTETAEGAEFFSFHSAFSAVKKTGAGLFDPKVARLKTTKKSRGRRKLLRPPGFWNHGITVLLVLSTGGYACSGPRRRGRQSAKVTFALAWRRSLLLPDDRQVDAACDCSFLDGSGYRCAPGWNGHLVAKHTVGGVGDDLAAG